jgi:hypothetical protein
MTLLCSGHNGIGAASQLTAATGPVCLRVA